MGVVYLAVTPWALQVAVKLVHPYLVGHPELATGSAVGSPECDRSPPGLHRECWTRTSIATSRTG